MFALSKLKWKISIKRFVKIFSITHFKNFNSKIDKFANLHTIFYPKKPKLLPSLAVSN